MALANGVLGTKDVAFTTAISSGTADFLVSIKILLSKIKQVCWKYVN